MDYDLEYFEKMLRLNSATAEKICKIRWEWVSEVKPRTVLDYGSGVGWFRAHRPPGTEVFTFDVGPFPQTGIPLKLFDVVCFWDTLEHIPDFSKIEPILALTSWVALTLPIVDGPLSASKHFKPGEHLHYFTEDTLSALFRKYGFRLMKKGSPECPPREEAHSFLFGRT